MSDLVDISVGLVPGLPTWPTSSGWGVTTDTWEEEGDQISNSHLTMDVHVGTHVEAPRHFLRDGQVVDELGLDPFVGSAHVIEVRDRPVVDAEALDRAAIPMGTRRLLVRTSNSDWWPTSGEFRDDFVGLDESAAAWIADRGLALVGLDYLSVQSATASAETHRRLLRAGVAIVEGLDLSAATAGAWTLVCLPLALVGTEGAPARAILVRPGAVL